MVAEAMFKIKRACEEKSEKSLAKAFMAFTISIHRLVHSLAIGPAP